MGSCSKGTTKKNGSRETQQESKSDRPKKCAKKRAQQKKASNDSFANQVGLYGPLPKERLEKKKTETKTAGEKRNRRAKATGRKSAQRNAQSAQRNAHSRKRRAKTALPTKSVCMGSCPKNASRQKKRTHFVLGFFSAKKKKKSGKGSKYGILRFFTPCVFFLRKKILRTLARFARKRAIFALLRRFCAKPSPTPPEQLKR